MSDSRFNPVVIDGRKPIEAIAKFFFWIGVAPTIGAFVWGISRNDNFMSVIGMAGRRATGAVIVETQPIGESLVNGATGKGLRPGQAQDGTFNETVRPGAAPAAERN